MTTFFEISIRDAATVFVSALIQAGYEKTDDIRNADFILADKEPADLRRRQHLERMILGKPIFFYPHTPYSYWLWDRWLDPMPVQCNFVTGSGAVKGMRSYGYPYRVESIGFSRCEVKPFQPTKRTRLLYTTPRTLFWKTGITADLEIHNKVMDWIIGYRKSFESITINYSNSMAEVCCDPFTKYGFKFVDIGNSHLLSARTALDAFENADIILGCNTAGYVALAIGKPAILANNYPGVPGNSATGCGDHWDLYKSHYEFPVSLFDMTVDDLLAVRVKIDSSVEKWKSMNIGENFNREKFISIIREYV